MRSWGFFFKVQWCGCKLLINVDQAPDRVRESLLSRSDALSREDDGSHWVFPEVPQASKGLSWYSPFGRSKGLTAQLLIAG